MPLDHIPIVGTQTEFTVPESCETLLLQQAALVSGRRPVQMFPIGSRELPLPDGMSRIELPRGIFHFDPMGIGVDAITSASERGRENEILGLGPYCKADIVATGESMLCVVERSIDGIEVLTAVSAPSTIADVIVTMNDHAGPGHTVAVETPESVIRDRLAARRS